MTSAEAVGERTMSTIASPHEPLDSVLRRFRAELDAEEVGVEARLRQRFRTRRERRYLKRRRGQGPPESPVGERNPAQSLERFAEAWIAGVEAEAGTPEAAVNAWALRNLWAATEVAPEAAWRCILAILQRRLPPRSFYFLAAGPLEHLLARHGPQLIERVELWARIDPEFKELLGAVWRNALAEDIWQRIQDVLRTEPEGETLLAESAGELPGHDHFGQIVDSRS